MRKDQHRGGSVDVKVEELDGCADEAGEENLACRVLGGAATSGVVASLRAKDECVAQASYCRWFRERLQTKGGCVGRSENPSVELHGMFISDPALRVAPVIEK